MSGQVVHFEIPVTDAARAEEFYRAAFGWRINNVPGLGYQLVYTTDAEDSGPVPGAINGGMLMRQEPINHPVITIMVDDIDATLAEVERLGGTVALGRQEVAAMGFSAYVVDPDGNLLGLWQDASVAAAQGDQPGTAGS